MHADMFYDICKIAAVNATTALSRLLQIPFVIESCKVEVDDFGSITNLADGEEKAISFYSLIPGNIPGYTFVFYHEATALPFYKMITKKSLPRSEKKMDDALITALSDITNVILKNFLTSIAQAFQLHLSTHPVSIYNNSSLIKIFDWIRQVKASKLPKQSLNFFVKFKQENIQGYIFIMFDYGKLIAVSLK